MNSMHSIYWTMMHLGLIVCAGANKFLAAAVLMMRHTHIPFNSTKNDFYQREKEKKNGKIKLL